MTSRPFHILLVCTGNTCRSPMAEAIARELIAESGRNLKVSSAGMVAADGEGASPEAVVAMAACGLDLEHHRARQLTPQVAASADVIWAMTAAHTQAAKALAPQAVVERLHPDHDISDPFGQSLEVYEEAAEDIRQALQLRLLKMKP